jgi:Fe-S oxidoreductase/nitrate reductase gamma subunit
MYLMEPSRQIMWNIGNRFFLDVATVVAAVSLVRGFAVRIGTWRQGKEGVPAGNRRSRLFTALRTIVNQKGMIRGRMYLIMHRCVFYGMFLLFAGSVMVALEMHLGLNFIRGATYLAFTLVLDCAGIAVLVGVGLAVYKRYFVKPDRLESGAGDAFQLMMLAAVVLSGFLLKGMRIIATSDPWAAWSPVGYATAILLGETIDTERAMRFHPLLWYGHAALAFTLIALIPWTKLLHLFTVPLSIFLSVPRAERASLSSMSVESPQRTGTIADCTRKQLIEADACIACGRCKKLCSIYQGGIPFAPVTLMKNLRDLMRRGSRSSPLAGSVIGEAALWSCTACRSCEERCPMDGEHALGIIEIRRGEIERKQTPEFVEARFAENKASLASAADRFKLPDCNSDVYIWPGCRDGKVDQGATLQSVLKLMKRAGLTATILEPQSCCGGPIRRLGNETLFRQDAMANIAYLKAIEGATIITCCPHCFNTLKNEYPRLGAGIRVMHHSQYLAGLLAAGKLPAGKSIPLKATFHDPCFLGRYNDEYSSPRKLLRSMEGLLLLEMKHSRQKSLCCGSGGGTVPSEVAAANGRKWIRQALKEGVEAVITGCPYCRENLVAAAREEHPDRTPRIMDVVEIFD